MSETTHWRKLHNPEFFGSYLFQENEDIVVKITKVDRKIIKNSDGKDEEHTIVSLENQKPWIMNVTNAKMISKVIGSPMVEHWIGKSVKLYVKKIRAFGESVDAVRVRPTAPALPELSPTSPNWEKAKKAIADKKTTVAKIKEKYTLSVNNEKLLTHDAS